MPAKSSEDKSFSGAPADFDRSFRFTYLMILGAGLLLPMLLSQAVQAQGPCTQEYLDSLPKPVPVFPTIRVVQIVNCSDQIILGASTASGRGANVPVPVFPREKTWVMQPFDSSNWSDHANVLTIDIPPEWSNTAKKGSHGPNIWARTGCRYDPVSNRAQCETGSCGDQYDCSSANLTQVGFTSFTEWNFYQTYPPPNENLPRFDSFDISLVNGASLTVDVQAVGGTDQDPLGGQNTFWWSRNNPMAVWGQDLRSSTSCTAKGFLLNRSDMMTDKGGAPHLEGQVIMNQSGLPADPTDPTFTNSLDGPVACFNNCGMYEFGGTPAINCDPTDPKHPKCYRWLTFCAGNPANYGTNYAPNTYPSINDCINPEGTYDSSVCPVNGVCWNQHIAGQRPPKTIDGTCQLRGFISAKTCADTVCTYPYGFTNPWDQQPVYSSQPPFGSCEAVAKNDPGKGKANQICIGDDTIHAVFPHAYTWPNDPQTYTANAPTYRIIYSPGGTTAKITPSVPTLPLCSELPGRYNYSTYVQTPDGSCVLPAFYEGAQFAVARLNENDPTKGWISKGNPAWSCNIDQRGGDDSGVLCAWKTSAGNCSPPVTDKYVTQSACGRTDSSRQLVSGAVSPNSTEMVYVEVTIAGIKKPAARPTLSGCSNLWASPIAEQFVQGQNKNGYVAWYGSHASGGNCQVTVTLANENPAEMKVYVVPAATGLDTTSSATGYSLFPQTPTFVSAGVVTIKNTRDLMMGSFLQVNDQPTPATYWQDWLTNSPNQGAFPANLDCVDPSGKSPGTNDHWCPTDDGTDWLPGHSAYSANANAGHQLVGPATFNYHRDANTLGKFAWGGVAIYVKLQ